MTRREVLLQRVPHRRRDIGVRAHRGRRCRELGQRREDPLGWVAGRIRMGRAGRARADKGGGRRDRDPRCHRDRTVRRFGHRAHELQTLVDEVDRRQRRVEIRAAGRRDRRSVRGAGLPPTAASAPWNIEIREPDGMAADTDWLIVTDAAVNTRHCRSCRNVGTADRHPGNQRPPSPRQTAGSGRSASPRSWAATPSPRPASRRSRAVRQREHLVQIRDRSERRRARRRNAVAERAIRVDRRKAAGPRRTGGRRCDRRSGRIDLRSQIERHRPGERLREPIRRQRRNLCR